MQLGIQASVSIEPSEGWEDEMSSTRGICYRVPRTAQTSAKAECFSGGKGPSVGLGQMLKNGLYAAIWYASQSATASKTHRSLLHIANARSFRTIRATATPK